MFHHNTIRKYTLALLNFFNRLEIQYKNDSDQIIVKKIPLHYKFQEKEMLMDKTETQILSGNMNTLPRAVLELTSLKPNTNRQTSKYNKINRLRLAESQEYQYNCLSYDFDFSLSILCRGMSEACQIVEQIAPMFNPNVAIDVFDAENEETPTRVPLQLGDIGIEPESFGEKSMNICTVKASLSLSGYLFQPIRECPLIKELKMSFNTPYRETEMFTFAVKDGVPQWAPKHEVLNQYRQDERLYLEAVKLEKTDSTVEVVYDTNSREKPAIKFVAENATISEDGETCTILASENEFAICAILDLGNLHTSIYSAFKKEN